MGTNCLRSSEPHQKGRGTDAVHPLELNQLRISKAAALFPHLSCEMSRWHEKRSGKVVGDLLQIYGGLLVNQPMRQLMREREPPPLQRMRLVDNNDGHFIRHIHVLERHYLG